MQLLHLAYSFGELGPKRMLKPINNVIKVKIHDKGSFDCKQGVHMIFGLILLSGSIFLSSLNETLEVVMCIRL